MLNIKKIKNKKYMYIKVAYSNINKKDFVLNFCGFV